MGREPSSKMLLLLLLGAEAERLRGGSAAVVEVVVVHVLMLLLLLGHEPSPCCCSRVQPPEGHGHGLADPQVPGRGQGELGHHGAAVPRGGEAVVGLAEGGVEGGRRRRLVVVGVVRAGVMMNLGLLRWLLLRNGEVGKLDWLLLRWLLLYLRRLLLLL